MILVQKSGRSLQPVGMETVIRIITINQAKCIVYVLLCLLQRSSEFKLSAICVRNLISNGLMKQFQAIPSCYCLANPHL